VGEPIDPDPEAATYATEGRVAVRKLTERIAAGLAEATPRALAWPGDAAPAASQATRTVLLPAAVLGVLLNWLPYRLPGWVARVLTRTPDEAATYKILTALLAFPAFWIAEAVAVGMAAGAWAGVAMAVLAPATGYAALLFHDRLEAGLALFG
jgi:hypothetical protein